MNNVGLDPMGLLNAVSVAEETLPILPSPSGLLPHFPLFLQHTWACVLCWAMASPAGEARQGIVKARQGID